MGSAEIQSSLWGKKPREWSELVEPHHIPLWSAMLDSASVKAGTSLLDVGCGGGGASALAVKRGARVSGVDATKELLAYAQEREPTAAFRVADIEDMPYEDGEFEVVFAANVIQYADNRVRAIEEMRRVCAPGGCIIAGLFGPPDRVEFKAILGAIRDALPEPPAGAGPFELSLDGALEAVFEEAGLSIESAGEVDCPFDYRDLATFWNACTSGGPLQALIKVVGEEKLEAAVLEAVKPYVKYDGSVLIQPNIFRYVLAQV